MRSATISWSTIPGSSPPCSGTDAITRPLTLLTGYQAPAAIRRIGAKRLEIWLPNRRVVRSDRLAETAVQAAERQHTSLPGEKRAARLIHALANECKQGAAYTERSWSTSDVRARLKA